MNNIKLYIESRLSASEGPDVNFREISTSNTLTLNYAIVSSPEVRPYPLEVET